MQASSQIKNNEYTIIIYLLAITLLAHGLALVNNGVYWDGALLYGFYQEHNLEQLHLLAFSMGLPLLYYINQLLWWLGYSVICNVVGVASIYLISLFSYQSARLFCSVHRSTAVLISTFVILYPGSMTTFYHATLHYYILYATFSAACYLGLKMEKVGVWKSYILRITSLGLFFFSFTMKSLLIFYILFIVCSYILYCKESLELFLKPRNVISFLTKRLDFFFLPVFFVVLCQLFFKPYADATGYNAVQAFHFLQFVYYLFLSIEFSALRVLWFPVLVFLFFLMFYIKVSGIKSSHKQSKNRTQVKPYLILLLLGGIAFLLAILPYILVGKPPIYDSISETRFALLVPLPLAIMMAGAIGVFFTNPTGKLNFLGKSLVVIFCIFFIVLWNNNYLRLEAETAIKKSFIFHLEQNKSWGAYSIYWIRADGFNASLNPAFAYYEWAWLLNEAYSGHSRMGMSNKPSSISPPVTLEDKAHAQYERDRHNIKNINSRGCQAMLVITPGINELNSFRLDNSHYLYLKPHKIARLLNPGINGINPIKIGLDYMYYRFIKPQAMQHFLSGLINIKVTPYFSSEATDCNRS